MENPKPPFKGTRLPGGRRRIRMDTVWKFGKQWAIENNVPYNWAVAGGVPF